jgi:adenosyl cobinamide kinase/adenosyl cobinamide phosphate guanylyltransferase
MSKPIMKTDLITPHWERKYMAVRIAAHQASRLALWTMLEDPLLAGGSMCFFLFYN